MSIIIEKIKQKYSKKSKNEPEKFMYATDWLKSTEKLKTYDELTLSLVHYCSYVDKQEAKVKVYFAQKNGGVISQPNLYSNFSIEKTEKETISKMESEKYAAYTYSKHYNTAMSQLKQNEKVTVVSDNAKPKLAESDCFGSKK